ncbi:hypothetical protein [Planococcus sp. ISL-110]|uniref:hypothetical protein n=1 Tax=Planococcus sp. ISL-110 TaxID=2819167 RepID=UPI001BEACD38|nr:hypothetical protein [Planococcus sp. ISL-110]MBT2569548.1 hypothetical protein [Planococcus sp. ISL-110]
MLQYVQYYQENTGPTIVAIPALGERKEIFEALAKNLTNFRFLAVDLPGHTNRTSDKPLLWLFQKKVKLNRMLRDPSIPQ